LKEIVFEFDQAEIRYSESRKLVEIAAHVSQNPSVWVAIDGDTGSRAS
jgi:outer membrane protein OmpA-like peptidoglycan-associated protein